MTSSCFWNWPLWLTHFPHVWRIFVQSFLLELRTHISTCYLDLPTWISSEYLKPDMSLSGLALLCLLPTRPYVRHLQWSPITGVPFLLCSWQGWTLPSPAIVVRWSYLFWTRAAGGSGVCHFQAKACTCWHDTLLHSACGLRLESIAWVNG